jgi:hypothetical protein
VNMRRSRESGGSKPLVTAVSASVVFVLAADFSALPKDK